MDEQDLIQRLKAGDPMAKDELAAQFYRRLYATACYVLGYRDEDVEDAVQDTFVAALKSLDRFEGRSGLYTWLNHICVNQCFDRLRKRRRMLATESAGLELLLMPAAEQKGRESDEQLAKETRLAGLKALISGLGEPCASLLRWRYEDGLALNELKEKLRQPLGTVAARLRRCLGSVKSRAVGSLS